MRGKGRRERQKHPSVFISTSDIKELNYMPRRIPIDVMLILLWIGSEGRYLVSVYITDAKRQRRQRVQATDGRLC